MNRHEATEPLDIGSQFVVPVTPDCSARWGVSQGASPRLTIDYGGAELVLEVAVAGDAEVFALALALTALDFASHCRYLVDGSHD
jgi:hypothetical protein